MEGMGLAPIVVALPAWCCNVNLIGACDISGQQVVPPPNGDSGEKAS